MSAADAKSSYRVLITGPDIAEDARELLSSRGCQAKCVFGENGEELDALEDHVREFAPHAIIVRKGNVDRAVLSASDSLRVVCKHGVGVDNIAVGEATELGIVVMNTPTANFNSVAEHTLALMFALARRIPQQDRRVRQGKWDKRDYTGQELAGKTLGLIGLGRIGRRVADLAAPLQMSILAYDPAVEAAPVGVDLVNSLEELLSRADIVSLHCPLTPKTRGMIGREQLALMRPGSWVVNTARGAIVDEQALVAALRDGPIGGAALDTFETEPPAPDNPLFALDNVVLTNHVGGISPTSYRNMGVSAVQNVLAVLEGGRVDASAVLNPEVLEQAR